MKRKIYFNEYNLKMGNAIYLPIVSGSLSAYIKQNEEINANYEVMPFNFLYDEVDTIVDSHKDPSVAAFSACMWNINLCLAVAKKVKEKYPNCLVIFGGPSVPFNADTFMTENPYIDISVRGEGELRLEEILKENLSTKDFSKIKSISYLDSQHNVCQTPEGLKGVKDLTYPSPYTTGEFDHLLKNKDFVFQAIIETNRGCPYNCSFCFWGMGGLNTKYSFFSIESIRETAEWIGKNQIPYVFCADSNFGIHQRDLEIANIYVETKKKYGFPEKFRVCYAKNSPDTVFDICRLFHQNLLEKGATLSFQTVSEEVGKNIGRKNIKLSVYKTLQKKYNEVGIPVYTELIIGLPGETVQSFSEGIEYILRAGIKNQLFCYFCQVYPNTDLSNPDYQKRFGIKTVSIPMTEIHCSPKESVVKEFEDIIVTTNAMNIEDWKVMAKISWLMQFLFSMKAAFYIMILLQKQYDISYIDIFKIILAENGDSFVTLKKINTLFEKTLHSMLTGVGKCEIDQRFGNIYWDIEEIVFLATMHEGKSQFYNELKQVVIKFLESKNIAYDAVLIDEVFLFNESLVFNPLENQAINLDFTWNIPEFFDRVFTEEDIKAHPAIQTVNIEKAATYESSYEYAKQVVLWGRKSGRILRTFKNTTIPAAATRAA